MDDDSEKKKVKGTKKALISYENYIDSLYNGTVILRSQQRFKVRLQSAIFSCACNAICCVACA